jgi:hypothetical protein
MTTTINKTTIHESSAISLNNQTQQPNRGVFSSIQRERRTTVAVEADALARAERATVHERVRAAAAGDLQTARPLVTRATRMGVE